MQYAERYCTVKDGNYIHTFSGRCIVCKKCVSVEVPSIALHDYRRGALIQDALSMVSKDDREFLMSGICGSCYDEEFKEDGNNTMR